MHLQPLPSDTRIEPGFPIELLMSVDEQALRISIEWSVVDHFLGPRAGSKDAVRAMLHEKQQDIERVVKAHVFAQGMPMSHELVLTVADFTSAATGGGTRP